MSSTRPSDALDLHVNLIRWLRTFYGQTLVSGFAESFQHDHEGYHFYDTAQLPSMLAESLNRAQTYVVSPHISTKLWAMGRTLSAQPLLPQDLPEPNGFVLLEDPLLMYDIRRKIITIKAIHWTPISKGLLLFMFSDRSHELDEISVEVYAAYPDAHKWETRLALSHISPIYWGTVPHDPGQWEKKDILPDDTKDDNVRLLSFIQIFWDFVTDQIPSRIPPYRAQRRRMQRENITLADIKVVDLRVLEQHPDPQRESEEIAWSHRWRVRRHQRRQWYGTGPDRHQELIWIESHIRGPEWLPLIEQDTVMRVRR